MFTVGTQTAADSPHSNVVEMDNCDMRNVCENRSIFLIMKGKNMKLFHAGEKGKLLTLRFL